MDSAEFGRASRLRSLSVVAQRPLGARPESGIRVRVVVFGRSTFDFRVPWHQFRQSRQLLKTRAENTAGRAKRNCQKCEQDKPHGETGTGYKSLRGGEYINAAKLPIDEFATGQSGQNSVLANEKCKMKSAK